MANEKTIGAEPGVWAPTVSRPELLQQDGSDTAFRSLLHGLMSYGRMVSDIRESFGKAIGVSGVQYEILMIVQRHENERGIMVRDIAAAMHRSGAFVTIEIGKLEAKGLVDKKRDTKDRRQVMVRLTERARVSINRLSPLQCETNDTLFEALDAREFDVLCGMVKRLIPCGERALDLIEFRMRDAARQS